ncbi:hypothetical protein HYPSUDRAFT_48458 [Hypholoma sublateritium FD-334 SS-4]|uniref:Uncharacterized protein n=1 Tax=Hypholoma sublateritium (strain FD-334 SS-4) TaxID=945553 RepID=A0A0D2P492_HYPSF|nr:hypothetical protein HYPSUDRAFT_48458 [Hypholoma sublateritium FD-334 SS-4]
MSWTAMLTRVNRPDYHANDEERQCLLQADPIKLDAPKSVIVLAPLCTTPLTSQTSILVSTRQVWTWTIATLYIFWLTERAIQHVTLTSMQPCSPSQ